MYGGDAVRDPDTGVRRRTMSFYSAAISGVHRVMLIIIGLAYFIAAVVAAWVTFWGGALAVGAGNSTEAASGILYLSVVILLLFGGVGLVKNLIPGKAVWWKIPISLVPAALSIAIVLIRFAEWKVASE